MVQFISFEANRDPKPSKIAYKIPDFSKDFKISGEISKDLKPQILSEAAQCFEIQKFPKIYGKP